MLHKGVFVLAVMAALGLAVTFFVVTWLSSPGAGPRPVAAALPDEELGDAIVCGTGQPVMDAALDIAAVSVDSKQGGYDVHVRFAGSATAVFTNAYSAAVLVTLGNQTGIAEIHAGTETRGLEDNLANIIPGTEDNVRIEADGVHFNFPGELKEGAELEVETFHAKTILDDVECDTAFSDDPTAPKPTATSEPTATPPPTDTPEPGTDPPTPTATPELCKVRVEKANVNSIFGPMVGWEMKVYDGDGCTGSPIRRGLTGERTPSIRGGGDFSAFSIELPAGDYSAAETQQPGWELAPGTAFCQNFTVPSPGRVTRFFNRATRNGDVNGDGATDSRDASVVLQFTADLATQDDITDFFRGDVNLDDTTDSRDATLILQFDAGLIPSLPVGGS